VREARTAERAAAREAKKAEREAKAAGSDADTPPAGDIPSTTNTPNTPDGGR
jgi:hypothetical protein